MKIGTTYVKNEHIGVKLTYYRKERIEKTEWLGVARAHSNV